MTPIRSLVSALCLVSLFIICSSSKAQSVGAGTTGNLIVGAGVSNAVSSGWQGNVNLYPDMNGGFSNYAANNVLAGREFKNGVAIGSLGPESINFGANMSTIWQNINVKNALNSTATGLQVNGFTYSMRWKNGNNWDNAMTDQLYTFVNVIDSKNRVIDSKNYSLSYNTGSSWWQSSWTDTFRTPYAADQLKTIQFGFQGKDNNGNWYGYYGPELANVNLRLNYSIDPCVGNPLAHSNCSGYSAALAKLSNPTTAAIATASTAATVVTSGQPTRDATNTSYTSPNVGGGTISTTGVFKPNDGIPQAVTNSIQSTSAQVTQSSTLSTGVTNTSSSTSSTQSTTSTASTTTGATQNAGATTQATQSPTPTPTPTRAVVTQAPTLPTATITQQSVQTTASQQPIVQQSFAQPPQAAQLVVQQPTAQVQQPTQQQQSSQSLVQQPSMIQPFAVQVVRQGGAGNGIAFTMPVIVQQQTVQQNPMTASYGFSNNLVSISAKADIVEQVNVQQVQVEQPAVQQVAMLQGTKIVTTETKQPLVEVQLPQQQLPTSSTKSSPVSELLSPKIEIDTRTEVKVETTTVKTTVVANELAGGVDTSMMVARAPGFDKYTNTTLIDAPFYKTDSIYKNQFVVDNARAQRLLGRGSELKWQQIVDSQYKIGE